VQELIFVTGTLFSPKFKTFPVKIRIERNQRSRSLPLNLLHPPPLPVAIIGKKKGYQGNLGKDSALGRATKILEELRAGELVYPGKLSLHWG
jgi:hypothetical protein